ncbi:MAG: archease [Nitrososphaeraceae archaeon]|nr:archease [Nitrososphaeraceae archaeon]
MEEKFKYLDHMTDLIVEAYGHTLQELLENSALGLINAMFDMSNVELNHKIKIIAHGHDFKSLLYDWIEKIILSIYIDRMIVTKFDSFSFSKIILRNNNDNNKSINNKESNTTNLPEMEFLVVNDLDLDEDAEKSNSKEYNSIYKIECIGNGDIIDLHKHEYKVEVKSITYHEMEIKRNQAGYYTARFLVDL